MIGMSKGRKWRVDLLSGNSAAVLVLGGLFLLGSMAGCITAGLFQDDQGLVRQSVSAACSAGVRPGFWLCLRGCGLWCLAALLLGFSALGVFGLPVLFLCRGFVLCYAVGVFYRLWGTAGLWAAVVVFGLPALLWLPALFALGAQGLPAAVVVARGRGKGKWTSPYNSCYFRRCALCALLVILCACVEYACVPALLKLINGALTLF